MHFDSYIFVDWGAANKPYPKKETENALWLGECPPPEKPIRKETYCRTRQSAFDHVLGRLLHHTKCKRRILIGFDFPYGYPRNFGRALGFRNDHVSWRNIWTELSSRLVDHCDNANNRFSVASELNKLISDGRQGPFWGCPSGQATPHLETTGPGFPYSTPKGCILDRWRICDERLKGVQEVWGLFGAGRVGSQALTGIPRVHQLKYDPRIAGFSKVWPFETGFSATPSPDSGPFILHAEIWPGVVKDKVNEIIAEEPGIVKDKAQVRAMCEWASCLDQENKLGALFDEPIGLDSSALQQCVQEEGWILGAE